jgi:uncharacterized protein YndB with AHSA1/START domain
VIETSADVFTRWVAPTEHRRWLRGSCATLKTVADERERHESTREGPAADESGQGATHDDDREVRLHSELAHEAKRVVTHPAEETHRLTEELRAGEVDSTPVIALTGLAIWLAVIVAIVIALVFIAIYLI